jgi:hypothetical protein
MSAPENIHRLALELDSLDNVAARVFTDNWLHEREELIQRLETLRNDLDIVLSAITEDS